MRIGLLLILVVLVVQGAFAGGSGGGIKLPLKARQTSTLITSVGKYFGLGPKIPLTGNLTYWGEYFTVVGLGSPAQNVELQVDTGSADLIVYSNDCDGCNATASYDYSKSDTAMSIWCDTDEYLCDQDQCQDELDPCCWEDQFGDGSTIDGFVVTDVITLGGTKSSYPVSLGPITSVDAPNGFEATGVDGIWGLAFQDLSGWSGEPAIALFISEFNLYDSFSLCLLENGGTMEIGTNYSGNPDFVWTPIEEDQWYSVTLDDWLMGGVTIGVSNYDLNYYGIHKY
jgi:hypothetical protein